MSAPRPTVVLVDDTGEVRLLVRSELRLDGGFAVVGEGSTGHEAISLAEQLRPEVLLLDVSLPELDGLAALPAIRAASPDTRVVMYSGFEEPALAEHARSLGAVAFISKSRPLVDLADSLRVICGIEPQETIEASHASDARAGWTSDRVLAQHADEFPTLFARAGVGLATLTLTGRVMRANEAMSRLVGVTHPLLGTFLHDVVHPEQRDELERLLAVVSRGARTTARLEHRLSGDERWVQSTLALVTDASDSPLYLFLQSQDVTAQREAEQALRASEERFRLLVEGVRDYGIFMLDPDGHIASWNAGAARLKGYTAEEAIGRHFRMFYTSEAQQARHPENELAVAIRTGRYEEEGWRVRKDGSQFWANVVITALRDGDELLGFAKVTRDVTERQRLAADRALSARAVELLGVIAHELRSPVGVITGTASLLSRSWSLLDEQERADMLSSLVTSGGRISRLVDDLLTASRLEMGALEICAKEGRLAPLIDEAVATAKPGGAEVCIECPADLMVGADPDRLQQMLVNYLSNAFRYGAPPVDVAASAAADCVEIRVRDRGAPLDKERLTGLFEKFPAGRDRRGTGLGLFIVRELARAHGGDAWYEPVPDGGGNVFGVRLPRRPLGDA